METLVNILITGLGLAEDQESITTMEKGNLLYKNPYYYVAFEETIQEDSKKSTKTILKFNEKELRVTRKGEIESTLYFTNGGIHNSVYVTPLGNFEVEIKTEKFKVEIREEQQNIRVNYQIGFAHMPYQEGNIVIEIKKSFDN